MYKRILCAVDFSDDSREAMHEAAELARQSQAVLVLVHVWQPPLWLTTADYQLPGQIVQETVDLAERTLETWKTDARKLGAGEVIAKFLTGSPWDMIVSTAREDDRVDLIVMGTHGRTGLRRALIGSVAEKVVRHAPCAVLVCRSRETN